MSIKDSIAKINSLNKKRNFLRNNRLDYCLLDLDLLYASLKEKDYLLTQARSRLVKVRTSGFNDKLSELE